MNSDADSTHTAEPPLSGPEQRLMAAVAGRMRPLQEDLRRLVNIPTGRAPHPAAVEGLDRTRQAMQARLSSLGAVCELVPGDPRPGWLNGPAHFRRSGDPAPIPATLVARRGPFVPGRGGRPVLLSGHLDTVHDPDPGAPFRLLSVAADGKTATGPGVVDMKGGLVIALHALEALAECGFDVPFGFVLNSDEESGSFHSDRALRAEASRPGDAPGSRHYACAIALEPANGPTGLVVSRGGSGQFLLRARGRSAHVGRDYASGRSATDLLARAIIAAHGLNDATTGAIVNVSTLLCDQPPNQVSDQAVAWGNLRFTDQAQGQRLAAGLTERCAGLSGAEAGVSVDVSLIRPAKPATAASSGLAERVRALGVLLGQPITFVATAGVCDGNNLQAGEPGGPAEPLAVLDTLGVRGGGLHTTEEWIDLASLVERCQLLALLLLRQSVGAS